MTAVVKQNPRLEFIETEDGICVRSRQFTQRGEGDPRTMLRTGRWPSGEHVSASDSYDMARFICPVQDKRARR